MFYPNAISSSQKIRHIKPAAQSICTERRKILQRLVITDNPPEGDQRQEKQPGVHSRLPHPLRTLAGQTDRETDRQAEGAALTPGQAGAGGWLSPFGGWSFVIADLSRLFAVFLLQTSLGHLPVSSSQTGSVSKFALADLTRAGGEDAAHRSPTVGPPPNLRRDRPGAPRFCEPLDSGTQSSAHLGAAKPTTVQTQPRGQSYPAGGWASFRSPVTPPLASKSSDFHQPA